MSFPRTTRRRSDKLHLSKTQGILLLIAAVNSKQRSHRRRGGRILTTPSRPAEHFFSATAHDAYIQTLKQDLSQTQDDLAFYRNAFTEQTERFIQVSSAFASLSTEVNLDRPQDISLSPPLAGQQQSDIEVLKAELLRTQSALASVTEERDRLQAALDTSVAQQVCYTVPLVDNIPQQTVGDGLSNASPNRTTSTLYEQVSSVSNMKFSLPL